MAESPQKVGPTLLLILGSTLVAILAVEAWRENTAAPRPAPVPSPGVLEPSALDRAVPTGALVVPRDILGTAERRAAPWAPGLRLLRSRPVGPWEQHRATIRDESTGDARSYGIGDLLPHGSLLVGLSTGSAEVMVADRTLIRLHEDGRLEMVEDFRTADEAQPLQVVPDRDEAYRDQGLATLEAARGYEPAAAQAAIDQLINAGEPVVELLLPRVDSLLPMPGDTLCFPSAGGRCFAPVTEGDLVVGILERLTGQSFGDVASPDLSPEDRQAIHRSWLRWWGLE